MADGLPWQSPHQYQALTPYQDLRIFQIKVRILKDQYWLFQGSNIPCFLPHFLFPVLHYNPCLFRKIFPFLYNPAQSNDSQRSPCSLLHQVHGYTLPHLHRLRLQDIFPFSLYLILTLNIQKRSFRLAH